VKERKKTAGITQSKKTVMFGWDVLIKFINMQEGKLKYLSPVAEINRGMYHSRKQNALNFACSIPLSALSILMKAASLLILYPILYEPARFKLAAPAMTLPPCPVIHVYRKIVILTKQVFCTGYLDVVKVLEVFYSMKYGVEVNKKGKKNRTNSESPRSDLR
jgi:hypothetical protein